MQHFNMLLLAFMAFVISLTSAAAIASSSVSVTYTHPTGQSGHPTGSWKSKSKSKTAWSEWTGMPTSNPSISMTEDGTPTTSTIHTTETETVTAVTRRDEEHKSHSHGHSVFSMGPSWTGKTGMSKPTGTFLGTNSWTKTGSGMTTVTMAARDGDVAEDQCTMVLFKGGGFCLPSTKTKRGDDVMTRSHHHSQHQSDASPANTLADRGIPQPSFTRPSFSPTASFASSHRNGPGHGGKHTSRGMASVTDTGMMAPPATNMRTMSSHSAWASPNE